MSQFRVFWLLIFVTATVVACSGQEGGTELTANQQKLVAERIAPDGQVTMAGQTTASAVTATTEAGRAGDAVYNKSCVACHSSGVAGAPKLGDAAAWASRLAQGVEAVYANAIKGIRGMPPRGTCMDCSDNEIKATVDYILENSQ